MNVVLLGERDFFAQTLRIHGIRLPRTALDMLQVNIDKPCDLVFRHC